MRIDDKSILKLIKERGFWQVVIRPEHFEKKLLTLGECEEFLNTMKVSLRGWDYPHFSSEGVRRSSDGVTILTDWKWHKEVCKLYTTGQFLHVFGCLEDYLDFNRLEFYHQPPTDRWLSILNTLFTITEIFEFASRLSIRYISEKVFIEVSIYDALDRAFAEPSRYLSQNYTFDVEKISFSDYFASTDLQANAQKLARKAFADICGLAGMAHFSEDAFSEEQRKLLERRM